MTMATAAAVAFVVYSCRGKLSEAEKLDLSVTPLQRVDSMFYVQTENGRLKLRVEAGAMEKYETDSLDYELFPEPRTDVRRSSGTPRPASSRRRG